MSLTLYRLEGCPFCEYAVDALDALDLEYDSVWVEAMHSRRDEVKEVSGQRQVPVLIDEDRGVTLSESEHVVEYLERTYAEEDDALADVQLG